MRRPFRLFMDALVAGSATMRIDVDTLESSVPAGSVTVDKLDGDVPIVPIGGIIEYPVGTVPDWALELNGQAVSRTTYSALFALWGTTFGEGDGSTTFNVMDRSGRVGVGVDDEDPDFDEVGETGGEKAHTLTEAELPAHDHSLNDHTHPIDHDHGSVTSSGHSNDHVHNRNLLTVTDDPALDNFGEFLNVGLGIGPSNGGNAFAWLGGTTGGVSADHTHSVDLPNFAGTSGSGGAGDTGATGSGDKHNNLQPYIVTRFIVRAL